MARAALRGRLIWRLADVTGLIDETPRVRTIELDVPGWPGHLAGQHLDLRLTAPDGYQAQRSYSISTPPGGTRVGITVERIGDGEVSPYLAGELQPGDKVELRGPIGGYFVWERSRGGPLLLVGGGSGVAPLMAILRERVMSGSWAAVRLLASSRSHEDVIYRAELERLVREHMGIEVVHTLTRIQPPGWTGYGRRIDHAMLADVAWRPDERPTCYVAGPTGFVETVASALVDLGHDPDRIKTERFGPTGDAP